jgi:hypothetical protein
MAYPQCKQHHMPAPCGGMPRSAGVGAARISSTRASSQLSSTLIGALRWHSISFFVSRRSTLDSFSFAHSRRSTARHRGDNAALPLSERPGPAVGDGGYGRIDKSFETLLRVHVCWRGIAWDDHRGRSMRTLGTVTY